MIENTSLSCIMLIFGGTGDLTHRKLMPALYNLLCDNMISENFAVVSIGRREKNNEEYRGEVRDSIKKYSRAKFEESKWMNLKERIYYWKEGFTEDRSYTDLNGYLKILDKKYRTCNNKLYYLAVAPEFFDLIVDKLQRHNMVENKNSWQRLVIENLLEEIYNLHII